VKGGLYIEVISVTRYFNLWDIIILCGLCTEVVFVQRWSLEGGH